MGLFTTKTNPAGDSWTMWWICRCKIEPWVCFLDELTHRIHLTIRWLCDRHEHNITGSDGWQD